MKIKKEELLDAGILDGDGVVDGVGTIEDKIIDTARWSIVHEIVFKWTDGKTYQTTYSVGSTEIQDEGPWEYQDEVDVTEVREVEKLVKVWEPV